MAEVTKCIAFDGIGRKCGRCSSQMKDAAALDVSRVTYHTTQVDGLNVFLS